MENLIPKIQLSEDQEERLRLCLEERVLEAEEYHSSWEHLHNDYLGQYLTIPEYENKTWPWPGSSNLFLPLTRVTIDGIMAQTYDAMFSNDPTVKAIGFESSDVDDAELLSRFYGEFVWHEVLNLKQIGNDWNFDNCLDGTSAVKVRWNKDEFLRREQRVELVAQKGTQEVDHGNFMRTEPIVTGYDERIHEDVYVDKKGEAAVDVVDMQHLYVAPGTRDSLQWPECRWYFEEYFLTWEDLLERKRHDYKNIDDVLKAHLKEQEITEKERTERKQEHLSQSKTAKTARVLEFYLRWPLPTSFTDLNGKKSSQTASEDDEQAYWEEIIVTFLWDTKKISRIVPLWRVYDDGKRPHIDNRYSRLPRSFYGLGLAAKMRQLNAWMNSGVNQMVDFGTLQNLPFFFYEPATTGLLPDNLGLQPGQGTPVMNARGINIPRFQGNEQFWLQMLNTGQTWAERDSNVTDFNLGRTPQVPNAPRTARGTMAMIQQTNIAFGRLIALWAERYVELFRRVHSLYKHKAPDDMEFKLFNANTGLFQRMKLKRQTLAQDVDFQFQLNPNRQAEQQLQQQLFQLITGIPYVQKYPELVRQAAKKVWDSTGQKNFDQMWPPEYVQRFYSEQQQAAQAQQQQQGGQGGPPGGQPPPQEQQPPMAAQGAGLMPPGAGGEQPIDQGQIDQQLMENVEPLEQPTEEQINVRT